jgi:hypothetical protein
VGRRRRLANGAWSVWPSISSASIPYPGRRRERGHLFRSFRPSLTLFCLRLWSLLMLVPML